MGRATRWLRSLWGGKKESREHKDNGTMAVDDRRVKKRWSFKSARDSCDAAAPIPVAMPAEDKAWLRTLYTVAEKEQSKHAIAVAAATAAAADAAVAAAQAAVAVLRLTSHGRSTKFGSAHEWLAAVKIQRVFRGYLAKKALRALKALVKLQALVRGYLVRKQAAATFHSMQALIRAQSTVRAQKSRAFLNGELKIHSKDIHRSSLERYDETRSEHTSSFHLRQFSASLDNPTSGFDRSPNIVQIESCRPKSSSRRTAYPAMETSDESCFPNSMSSPLPSICPGRISIPDCHRSFNEHEWSFPFDKCRYSSTAHSTPRYMSSGASFTPSTPTKSVFCAGDGNFRRYLNSVNSPSYMNNTRSSEANVRSQSAPKQRPEPAGLGKRLPLSELVIEQSRASLSSVGMQKPQEAFSFKRAVVGRLDRSLQVSSEAERDFFLQKKW